MNQKMYSFNIKDTIKSFELFPKVFKILWDTRKIHLVLIIILSILGGLLPAMSILSTQLLLNAIQTSIDKDFSYILYPLIIYLGLNLSIYILGQINNYLQNIFRIDLNYKLSVEILNKAKMLSLNDFENSEVYDKLRRAQNEAIERPYAVFSTILGLISRFVGFISSLAIILYWKPWVSFIILIVPIASTLYMTKIGYIQYEIEYKRAKKRRKSWYFSYLMTNDIAFKEIKIYNLSDYFIQNYKKLHCEFIKQDKKLIKKQTVASFIFEILDQIVGGFVLFLIVKSAFIGEILIGNTVTYIRSLSSIKGNMQGVLGSLSAMYQNNLYIKQLFDFLDMPVKQDTDIKDKVDIGKIESIEFKNVSFKYPNRAEYALQNISFKISKGESLFLVGENGSGKTTLIKLLVGFYDDFEGDILVNDISIKAVGQENLREKIGVVFQDFNKYELSCRENIALGKLEFVNNDTKIDEAIDKAYAKEIVSNLSNGIDTQLGVWFDEGVQLSGGQWQKIALSRAFLRDADCYILDEPSSSLDPVSEYEILKKTSELAKNRISIFISHRLYNLSRMSSRILVLREGRIAEEGTHEELIKSKGYYQYLYNLQNNDAFAEHSELVI